MLIIRDRIPLSARLCCFHSMLHFARCTTGCVFSSSPVSCFGSIWDVIWVHTYHLALHVACWVGPLPHLSSYICRVWHAPHLLAHPLLYRECCCHPYHYISQGVLLPPLVLHLQGVLLPPLVWHFAGCVAVTLSTTLQGVLLPPLVLLCSRVCRCHP